MMDKDALFDFDDSVDNLSQVSEKYAPLITDYGFK